MAINQRRRKTIVEQKLHHIQNCAPIRMNGVRVRASERAGKQNEIKRTHTTTTITPITNNTRETVKQRQHQQ